MLTDAKYKALTEWLNHIVVALLIIEFLRNIFWEKGIF